MIIELMFEGVSFFYFSFVENVLVLFCLFFCCCFLCPVLLYIHCVYINPNFVSQVFPSGLCFPHDLSFCPFFFSFFLLIQDFSVRSMILP